MGSLPAKASAPQDTGGKEESGTEWDKPWGRGVTTGLVPKATIQYNISKGTGKEIFSQKSSLEKSLSFLFHNKER